MATAPFQLWIDLAAISTAVRSSGTVTVTTYSPHGITTGAYIQLDQAAGTAGTSMNGVYQVTATSGTTFTFAASGSDGTATVGSAYISYDLLNPLINYSGAAKDSALYVPTESLLFSTSGDGSGATSAFTVLQDDTPSDGPWFKLIPDQTRVRLVKKDTGQTPASDKSDVFFVSAVASINSIINGSGQGSISSVSLQDPTSLLEKIYVYTYNAQPRIIKRDGISREGGVVDVVTVITNQSPGFSVGGTVQIKGAFGGDNLSFNDNYVISTVTDTLFTASQNANTATGNGEYTITSAAMFGTTTNQVEIDPQDGLFIDDGIVVLSGITSTNGTAQNLINTVFDYDEVSGSTGDKFVVTLAGSVPNNTTFNVANGKITGLPIVTPLGVTTAIAASIPADTLETAAVTTALAAVHTNKAGDYPLQRLINTASTAFISGASFRTNREEIDIAGQSLRSILDTIIDAYQAEDGKARRYFVDQAGNLNYGLIDTAAQPTYATAPYKIITSGTQNPNTTTAAATIIPYSLQIGFDHQTTKGGMILDQGTAYQPVYTTYADYGYSERRGAPIFDGVIPSLEVTSNYNANAYRYANGYFADSHLPLMSGYFTLRGAGTASHNQYGFSAGYAQTGGTAFSLVNRWSPGQWVDVTCAELGLSGLYRIEQVDWTMERGSFTQVITITFSYKPQFSLSSQLAQVR
jgi:hypothetical protein